jgi:rubrerythrin
MNNERETETRMQARLSDRRCVFCGYGIAPHSQPSRCPMCGAFHWVPVMEVGR